MYSIVDIFYVWLLYTWFSSFVQKLLKNQLFRYTELSIIGLSQTNWGPSYYVALYIHTILYQLRNWVCIFQCDCIFDEYNHIFKMSFYMDFSPHIYHYYCDVLTMVLCLIFSWRYVDQSIDTSAQLSLVMY